MIFDTHCHPYLAKNKSQEDILENFFKDNVKNILISIGVDIESSETSIKLALKYPNIYSSIGIHPVDAIQYRNNINEILQKLEQLYLDNRENIVAIGEIWLDYYWLNSLSEKYQLPEDEIIAIQKDFFRAQIKLAQKLSLPFIIHNREAAHDILPILRELWYTNFVFHCYSEDIAFAQRILEFAPDAMLGFGGILSFKNAKNIQNTAQNIPLKNILIETDAPYLTPTPYRGKEENEPLYIKYVLDTLIDIREESADVIMQSVYENSCNFFKIWEAF